MQNNKKPTPYDDINSVINYFLNHTKEILGANFVGMYLYGSLAIGDFDKNTSDIDFIVITNTAIPENEFILLRDLHQKFYLSDSPWSKKIEAAYIEQKALEHFKNDNMLYPQIEKGTDLIYSPLETGWPFQVFTLQEYETIVSGPPPKNLFRPVPIEAMMNSVKTITQIWVEQSKDIKESQFIRDENRFVIFTLCRFLYFFHTKKLASKIKTAQWAINHVEKKWSQLISKVLPMQDENTQLKSDIHFKDTVAFICHINTLFSEGNYSGE